MSQQFSEDAVAEVAMPSLNYEGGKEDKFKSQWTCTVGKPNCGKRFIVKADSSDGAKHQMRNEIEDHFYDDHPGLTVNIRFP